MRKNQSKFLNLLILPKLGRSFYNVAVSYKLIYVLIAALVLAVVGTAIFVLDYRELKKAVTNQHDTSELSEQVKHLSRTAQQIEDELELLEKSNRRIEEKTGIRVEPERKYGGDNYPSRGESSIGEVQDRLSDLRQKIRQSRQRTLKTERKIDGLLEQMASVPSFCPVRNKNISSGFGYRVHPISGRWEFHEGVDLKMPHGSPIYATADGEVNFASWRYGYGLVVYIDHRSGFSTRYAHCSRLVVRKGEKVRKGQIIALWEGREPPLETTCTTKCATRNAS